MISTNDLLRTPLELYASAKMGNKPILLVEGKDDFALYMDMINTCTIDVEVVPIDNIFVEKDGHRIIGCEGVICAIDKVTMSNLADAKKHILGIIDRDLRDFKKTNPKNELIFLLDRYSIENYFINLNSFKKCISHYTYINNINLQQEWVSVMFKSICEDLIEELFLLCIEAIKKQLDSNYQSDVDIDIDNPDRYLKDSNIVNSIKSKERDLLAFASNLSISRNINSLLSICKGKWLLKTYVSLVQKMINSDVFAKKCMENLIPQCQYCIVGNNNNCLFKHKIKCNMGETEIMIKSFEFLDIPKGLISRIKELKLA